MAEESGAVLPPSDDSDDEARGGAAEFDLLPKKDDELDQSLWKNRSGQVLADDFALSPVSLIGSWFHRLENGMIIWDGLVVGMIGFNVLLEVRSGLDGLDRSTAQVMLNVDKLTAKDDGYEFRFYDDREQMQSAYAEYLVKEMTE